MSVFNPAYDTYFTVGDNGVTHSDVVSMPVSEKSFVACKFALSSMDEVESPVVKLSVYVVSSNILGNEIGMGKCEYEIKGGKRYWNNVVRASWDNPDPTVILYGLYKFAEACDGYYQFTLSRLLDYDVESDGVSPAQIFGLDRKAMEQILTGLNINHPDFITAQFNLDLDTITLNSDKTSADVLSLF